MAALGVLLGSFGAHLMPGFLDAGGGSPEWVEKRLGQFDVAVRYHLWHAIALLALPAATTCLSPARLRIVMWLLVLGIVLFSGSLYLLVLLDASKLGMVTPLGGATWIAAWTLLAVSAFRALAAPQP